MASPVESLAHLATFVRVVDARGFTPAARQLGITKSAVSKQVRRLEDELGVRLLQRSTRSLSVTEAGRAYYEQAAQALALAEGARAAATRLCGELRGTIRCTASVALGRLRIVPWIPDFLALHPQLRVHLSLLDRFVDLAEEGFDIAIRISDRLPDGVVARRLADVQYAVCASPEHLARSPRVQRIADLAGCNCLTYRSDDRADHWSFETAAGVERVSVQGNFLVNSSEGVRQAVLDGLGIGLLPTFAIREELARGALVRLLPDVRALGPFGGAIHAIWLPDRQLPRKVRAFLDYLTERFAAVAEDHAKIPLSACQGRDGC